MKLIKLTDVFRVGSSKRVLKADWKESGVPFYRGREITRLSKTGFADNELFISESHFAELSARYGVPIADDIMVTAIGTIGNTYIVNESDRFYFKDASVLWLHKKAEVNSRFIDYWLKSDFFFEQLDKGNGATVDTLTIEKLSNVELLLPSPEVQREIVEKLDSALAEIDSLEMNLELGVKAADQLFLSILSSALTRAEDDFWQEVSLKEICEVDWGNTKLTKSSYVDGGSHLAVSAAGADGLIDHYEHEADVPVLSAIGAQCGRMFFPGARFTAIKNTITLTPKGGVTVGKFLYYLFTHVELPQRGAGQPFISKGDIEAFRVRIPKSLETQREIVEKLDSALAELECLKMQLKKEMEYSSSLRQSIFSSAFFEKEKNV